MDTHGSSGLRSVDLPVDRIGTPTEHSAEANGILSAKPQRLVSRP
jgi:hypothetical protein